MNDIDRKFEIELAQIGMRFGAFFAIGAAIFAIGVTLLFTAYDHLPTQEPQYSLLPDQSIKEIAWFFFGFGTLLAILANVWKRSDLKELRIDYMTETEKIPERKIACENHRPSFWLSKTHDGIDTY